MESLNGFNWIAGIYDRSASFIFGKTIFDSQLTFVNEIPANCNVLIIGGGTGRILEELIQVNPQCAIWYVDASSNMIVRAKERIKNFPLDKVHFIHGTVNSIPIEIRFDAVITNFFLDLFTAQSLGTIVEEIDKALLPGGIWLVTDFVDGKSYIQRLLLKAMYFFFSITCKLDTRQLPPWESILKKAGFRKLKSALFFNSFIKSAVYGKTQPD